MDRVTPMPPLSRLEVGGFTIDLGREALLDSREREIELRPQAYAVLRHLALNAGRLVTKEELLGAVWPGVVVTDDSLVQAVGDARRALGDDGHRVVKTIPRRGYMLVAAPGGRVEAAAPVSPGRSGRWLAGALAAALTIASAAAWLWRETVPQPTRGARPSIAVLAFRSLEPGADDQALARGMAEDLVSELARSPDLRVVSHQSSFRLSDQRTPLAEIGRALRSRYIVDGTVRRHGEQLRLVVELLDSNEGHVVWTSSQAVERVTMADARQALVSRVAGSLQARVVRTEEHRARARPPKALEVMVQTEHAKAMMTRYSAQGMRESRRLLAQALAIDPEYAPAWAFLGMTNTIDIGLRLTGEWDRSRIAEAVAQTQQAIALQPDLPIAYVALSQAQSMARDHEAALAAAKQCLTLSPNDADCHYILGKVELELGHAEAAARELGEALDLNPIPPAYLPAFYATALWASGRFDGALRMADDCLAKAPDFWRCRQDRIAALVGLGRTVDAREEAARLLAQVPRMTAEHFGRTFADMASALAERRIAAARAAGI
jgi:TolB-like protein